KLLKLLPHLLGIGLGGVGRMAKVGQLGGPELLPVGGALRLPITQHVESPQAARNADGCQNQQAYAVYTEALHQGRPTRCSPHDSLETLLGNAEQGARHKRGCSATSSHCNSWVNSYYWQKQQRRRGCHEQSNARTNAAVAVSAADAGGGRAPWPGVGP